MLDLVTAAAAAAMLNNSVSAVDKVYNWYKALKGGSPASEGLRSNPQAKVLQYVSLTDPTTPPRVVMTYEELSTRLDKADFNYIESFDRRMKLAMAQWEALNAQLPLLAPVQRVQIEANMEQMKDGDICASLRQIVDFIDRIGIDLNDHYRSVRAICPS